MNTTCLSVVYFCWPTVCGILSVIENGSSILWCGWCYVGVVQSGRIIYPAMGMAVLNMFIGEEHHMRGLIEFDMRTMYSGC
jgi:hypothetical protein